MHRMSIWDSEVERKRKERQGRLSGLDVFLDWMSNGILSTYIHTHTYLTIRDIQGNSACPIMRIFYFVLLCYLLLY